MPGIPDWKGAYFLYAYFPNFITRLALSVWELDGCRSATRHGYLARPHDEVLTLPVDYRCNYIPVTAEPSTVMGQTTLCYVEVVCSNYVSL